MLRRGARVLVGALVLVAALASGAGQAAADTGVPCLRVSCPRDTPVVSPAAEGGTLYAGLTITGTTTSGGTYQRTARIPVQPKCWYTRWFSGAGYAEFWSDPDHQKALAMMPPQYRDPLPGWQEHADDAQGGWYGPRCRAGVDGTFQLAYVRAHPTIWVPHTEPVPQTAEDIPPLDLAEAAYEAMDLPTGTVAWNPSVDGSGATVVNMDTWVWVTDAPTTATVTATVPSGTSVTVTAEVTGVRVAAPGADTSTCRDLGTAWTPGADAPGCAITFHRSTAGLPVKPGQEHPTATTTVTATWTASWTSTLDPEPQPLGSQDLTVTAEIPVAEIQSVVTG